MRQLRINERLQLTEVQMVAAAVRRAVNPVVREAARRLRAAEDQFLLGNPHRAIELLEGTVALCEEHGLEESHPYLKAHIDLYRICRAMGRNPDASRHFERAVSLGANASLLRLN